MALDDELIDRSPLERIKSQKHQKREPDPFDREETERILTYIHEHYDEQVWNWYEFAFGTGMRPSEQIVVQWRDVDWKRQSIRSSAPVSGPWRNRPRPEPYAMSISLRE